jgi:L-asparaginase
MRSTVRSKQALRRWSSSDDESAVGVVAGVHVYGLGGTIAVSPSNGEPDRGIAEIIADVPNDVAQQVDRATSWLQVPSADIRFGDLIGLAAEIAESVPPEAGVVISQGTDTLEDTAFVLDLLLGRHRTIVLTGAMRTPAAPGWDGGSNVADAIRVASSAESDGLGALVVFDGEIHAARFVGKVHAQRPGAFTSVSGPIGWISEGRVEIVIQPRGGVEIALDSLGGLGDVPPVAIHTAAVGDDGRLLPRLVDSGYAGLVIQGLGGGHVPSALAPLIGELAATIPVVLTRGTAGGTTLSATYSYAGSELDLQSRGVLNGGWLSARKARVLLSLLLGQGAGVAAVAEAFRHYGAPARAAHFGGGEVTRPSETDHRPK